MFGMKQFDIVVANPPYGAKLSSDQKEVYRAIYKLAKFKLDTFVLFIIRSFNLIKNQ